MPNEKKDLFTIIIELVKSIKLSSSVNFEDLKRDKEIYTELAKVNYNYPQINTSAQYFNRLQSLVENMVLKQ